MNPSELTPPLQASGPIVSVVVHGRGAIITRKIVVEADVPTTPFNLAIGAITPLADPGSVRVQLPEGSRTLVGVNARLDIPAADTGASESAERVDRLNRRIGYLHRRESALTGRIERLRDVQALPQGRKQLRSEGPLGRLEQALQLNATVDDRIATLSGALLDLQDELVRVTQERDEAELENMQSSSNDRGDGAPQRWFDLQIAAGEEPLRELHLSYAVPYAAKWWPQYTLRLTDGGTRATLAMEAVVAQRTGEDWHDIPLGLSTASIIFDATLPKLPSLRLGKVQPPEQRGFREPPTGLSQLFESYDAFYGTPKPPPPPIAPAPMPMKVRLDVSHTRSGALAIAPVALPASPPAGAVGEVMASIAHDFDEASLADEGAPSRHKKRSTPLARASQAAIGGLGDGAHVAASPAAPPPPPSHDPGLEWLEFDMLTLAAADDARRGQLKRRPAPVGLPESELFDAQDSARRQGLADPSASRGLFDYRYDSAGSCRVPADGRLHRVAVCEEQSNANLFWKTVPLVDPAVYREVSLKNPYDFPLLAGPVDVFSEGQLVTTTDITRIDAGGALRVGLGIDERIRVARNVRMIEEAAGLLGGKRTLTHVVSVELRSGLNSPVSVELVDRLPVTTDETVTVKLERESQPGTDYDQADLDQPVKGGRRWRVKLDGGARHTVEFTYEITLRSKDELVGGNRRG